MTVCLARLHKVHAMHCFFPFSISFIITTLVSKCNAASFFSDTVALKNSINRLQLIYARNGLQLH